MLTIVNLHTIIAFVTGVSFVTVNDTAVRIIWTAISLAIVDYYTVHYTAANERRSQCDRGSVNVSAGSSSGVVGGLITGEQYQFSVSVTVSGNEITYTGPANNLTDPFTVAANTNTAG